MADRFKSLLSFPFIICLIVLLANDFYLKETYHNTFTGKLSDVCGLFIFPIFWSAFFTRHRLAVFVLSGLLFIYWKSAYSSGFINCFSTYFFTIQRVVDYTDLIALPVLLLAWLHISDAPKKVDAYSVFRNVSPYPIAALTIFAFCATSQPTYIQKFDQPEYVLLKGNALPDSGVFEEDFRFYKFDSLVVVQVNSLYSHNRPAEDDDYNKNILIRDLDLQVIDMLPGIKSLVPPNQQTRLTVNTSQGNDHVQFKGSRLHGRFVRETNGKILIEGTYKSGLEDSIWTFRSANNKTVTKITFINGERTLVQQFDGNTLTSSNSINTRADVKRNKIIQIAILVLLMIGTISQIVKSHRNNPNERVEILSSWKWLASFLSPLIVWMFQAFITQLLGNYQYDLLVIPFAIFVVYVVTCPLFFIIIFWIKLKRKVDILWYCLTFALTISIWFEYEIFTKLSA
ncbi:hypothetical protein [uncultured Mucilaginibacter sp.]|uniref:hypothetical protein n=1 Tax=uncultured Mucilaginibacter sp. TaxID=797541 RepID=UPI002600FA97|nr:hypothetical protein [uncultured Mucilaginibacter sp.]